MHVRIEKTNYFDTALPYSGTGTSIADPHHFDPDPDPACRFDADPDSDLACHFDVDLDPTFHYVADPDPSFQIKAQNLEQCSDMSHIPYILACHLQIDADPDPAYHFDADPGLTF